MKPFARLMSLGVLGMIAVLVLAACGGDDPTPTPTSPPAAPPTATPTTGVSMSPEELAFSELAEKFEQEILPAALKEGTVTWYTCHNSTDQARHIDPFEARYNITVEVVQDAPGSLIERIKAEQAVGRVIADVYNCGGTSARILGWDGGAEQHTVPTAIDPSIEWAGKLLPSTDSKLNTLFGFFVGVIGINTAQVPEDKYPESWWDLVRDPFWEGKLYMGSPFTPGYLPTFMHVWLEDPTLGEEFVKALSDAKPIIIARGGAQQLAAGEIPMFIGTGCNGVYVLYKDAPLACHQPKEGSWSTAFLHSWVKGAPNSNAGLLFIDNVLSKPVQKNLSAGGMSPIRADVPVAISELALDNFFLPIPSTDEHEKAIRELYTWTDQKGYFK